MTDSGRILQASKVFGCFEEIMDGNLMLSNGSDEGPEAVSPHFEMTIDFVDEWLGRNVEALVINNVCVRLSDKENGLVHPEAAAIPVIEALDEADDDSEEAEVSAEAAVMEVVESEEEEEEPDDETPEVPSFAIHAEASVSETVEAEEEKEAGDEVPAIAAFELSRQASLLETAEAEDEEAPASQESLEVPSYSAQVEPAEEKRIVWPPFEDEEEEEEEEEPAETPSHSYALSQSTSEPKTDDHRNGETDYFRF